jgi:glycine cleavage system aminomethyltransferase T
MSQIFLPNSRRSPYHAATEAAGAVEYMVYNHMYMPLDYGRPPLDDYRALREAVTLWDVGAERQVQVKGPVLAPDAGLNALQALGAHVLRTATVSVPGRLLDDR